MIKTDPRHEITPTTIPPEVLLFPFSEQETPEQNPEVENNVSQTAEKVDFITTDLSVSPHQIGEFSEPNTTLEFELGTKGKNKKKPRSNQQKVARIKTEMEEKRTKRRKTKGGNRYNG